MPKYNLRWLQKQQAKRKFKKDLFEAILVIIVFLTAMAIAGKTFPY